MLLYNYAVYILYRYLYSPEGPLQRVKKRFYTLLSHISILRYTTWNLILEMLFTF